MRAGAMPQRIAMKLRYRGEGFEGSQIQPGKRTVAGTLKTELESLLSQPLHLQFAGRTDSGVHANGNVCAFTARLPLPLERLAPVLNARLPADLRIAQCWEAEAEFHPRFDARLRDYRYHLWLGDDPPVEHWGAVAAYAGSWDAKLADAALNALSGEHRYAAFCAGSLPREKSRCRLRASLVEGGAGQKLELRFLGDRFLHNMICRLMGSIMLAAAGRIGRTEIDAALAGERRFQIRPAPACGLVLEDVYYSDEALSS